MQKYIVKNCFKIHQIWIFVLLHLEIHFLAFYLVLILPYKGGLLHALRISGPNQEMQNQQKWHSLMCLRFLE